MIKKYQTVTIFEKGLRSVSVFVTLEAIKKPIYEIIMLVDRSPCKRGKILTAVVAQQVNRFGILMVSSESPENLL